MKFYVSMQRTRVRFCVCGFALLLAKLCVQIEKGDAIESVYL